MGSLSDRLHSAPFLRLLAPFIIGVLLSELFLPPKNPLYYIIPVELTLLLYFLRKHTFKQDILIGILFLLIFMSLGFSLAVNQRYTPQILTENQYYAVLDEFPIEKNKSYRAVIRLIEPELNALAYFEKSEELSLAQPGDLFFFKGCPELITNQGNPFEFDYKKYSIRNKIGHRIYLKKENYHFLISQKRLNLQDQSMILREKLMSRLSQNGVQGETFNVISAITFGTRSNLDPETTQSFTRTGTIHVLAVSGGNVAVIFLLLNFLLYYLKKYRVGIILHTLIIITGIWCYALITGLSPSVLRAATMFTFIIVGNNLSRKPDIYNSLAASAFILMCFNPFLLFDVGFQLSYAAVIAIVLLQPMLYKSLYLKYWIFDKVWLLLSVSLAAQLGTLPFSLYYFHQFPSYFWLSNMVVVPLVTILLYLTLLIIAIIPLIPALGLISAHFLNWIGNWMLEFLRTVEKLPYAVIERLYPSAYELIMLTTFCILTAVYLKYKKGKVALLALTVLALSLIVNDISLFNTLSRKEVVVFNIRNKILIAFTSGRKTTFLTSDKTGTPDELEYFTKPYKGYRNINEVGLISLSDTTPGSDIFLHVKKNFINYRGLKLCLINNMLLKDPSFEGFPKTDILLFTEQNTFQPLPGLKIPGSLFIHALSPVSFSRSELVSNYPANNEYPPPGISGAINLTFKSLPVCGNVSFNTMYFN
jgi:competence protein ComEC